MALLLAAALGFGSVYYFQRGGLGRSWWIAFVIAFLAGLLIGYILGWRRGERDHQCSQLLPPRGQVRDHEQAVDTGGSGSHRRAGGRRRRVRVRRYGRSE